MINDTINELSNSINNCKEHNEYKEALSVIKSNKEINSLVEEIKNMQKEATNLEYKKDDKYKEIDNVIEDKINILNENIYYKEYLSKLKNFNNVLLVSSSLIDEYVEEKVSI